MTWQALAESLSTAIEHMKMLDENSTEVFIPMSCLTIPVSELGTFLKIDDTALVDVLVDLWDGQLSSWGHKTKTQGATDIKNPWLNIIGCTTPSWLKSHFPEHMIGGGLTSRVIFVYGDAKRKLIPYPDEVTPDAEYRLLESNLVADLKEIAELSGPYTLTQAARAWGHEWYAKHWNGSKPIHLASDRYGGYLSRKQTHIHKLAIVLAAARSGKMFIEAEHLIEAEQLLATAEPHMLKVFESIGIVDEAKHVNELLGFVRAHGFLTSDALYKLVMNTMNQKEFIEAISAAVRGGLLLIEHKAGQRGVVAGKVH